MLIFAMSKSQQHEYCGIVVVNRKKANIRGLFIILSVTVANHEAWLSLGVNCVSFPKPCSDVNTKLMWERNLRNERSVSTLKLFLFLEP